MIATPRGEVPVETLRPGDKVITRDNGFQPICWTGSRVVHWAQMATEASLRPVLISQGSLGNDLPERDLMVSPNHRVLVTKDQMAVRFNEPEVLMAAKTLIGMRGVSEVNSMGTTYLHFMFSRHQVVLSNGAWTESFQPTDRSLKGMANAQRTEIYEIFPELRETAGVKAYTPARAIVPSELHQVSGG